MWREPGTDSQGLNVFVRLGGGPSDRNLVDLYFDTGLAYTGLIPGRDDDILALGYAHAAVSNRARALDRDTRRFSEIDVPLRNYESALELTYLARVTSWLSIQPDLQYIFHPGGHVADPRTEDSRHAIRDAFVAGLRFSLKL